jgi:hypothetical protein
LLSNFFLLDKFDEIQYFSQPGWIPPAKKTVPGMVFIGDKEGDCFLPKDEGGGSAAGGVGIRGRIRCAKCFESTQNLLCCDLTKPLGRDYSVLVILILIQEAHKSNDCVLVGPLRGSRCHGR